MIQIDIDYQGQLRTQATHGPSGSQITTDAPTDNHGRGERFSPTDMVASALGSCMLTIMGIYAQNHNIELKGSRCQVQKEMSASPRRIARLPVHIHIPLPENHPRRNALEQAALTCPVHQSLHTDIDIPVTFHWQQAD